MKNKHEKTLAKDKIYKKPTVSKDYQIGILVGENIVNKLPTLSTDILKNYNVIEVSKELSELWDDKIKLWTKSFDSKKFYENLIWYKREIEAVYLPKEINLIVYDFFGDEFNEEMVKGFKDSIWNCDLSNYVFNSAEVSEITSVVIIKMKYNK